MVNPVYLSIVQDIKEKIFSGQLKVGDPIASEMNLSKEYGTSRMTVRKSLGILSNEGYIYSIPGKGSFIRKPDFNKYIIYYHEMHNSINSVDKTKLLNVNIIMPNERLIDSLQITQKKSVILIQRLFYTDGEPIAYDEKYLIYHKGMPLVEKEIEFATFPEIISKGVDFYPLKKELAIYAQVPNEEIKRHLNIYNELALLVIEQKLYNNMNKPIGMGITYFRGDYIKLQGIADNN